MKNIRAVIIVLALLSTGGCSANVAQTSDEPWEESGSGLGPENSYVISIDTDSVIIPQTVSAEPAIDLSDYKNIVNHSSDIIYGEVESVENFNADGGTAWVKERVRVLETYKGRLLPGAEITVIQQTGYISVNDYINSYAKTDRETVRNRMLQNIPVEDAGNMVLDQTQGVPLDQAGDKIVFCLWVSPQSDGEKTYYEPVGDWAGKQVDMGNDTFAQFYPSVDSDAGRAAGENYETRSIDEMKELFETEQIRSLFR